MQNNIVFSPNFESIKNKGKYIDKTKIIFDLLNHKYNYYFLNGSRRFGKSLVISTLENFILGKKEFIIYL